MNREDIKEKIIGIIKNQLNINNDNVVINETDYIDNLMDIYGIDSLDKVEIIMELESYFIIDISDNEIEKCILVFDIINMIEDKIANKNKSINLTENSSKQETKRNIIPKAIITTSANPFHYGHLSLYWKAKEIFPEVKVIIAQNPDKMKMVNLKNHMDCYHIPYEIINDDITIADYCKKNFVTHIIRGIRNGVDAEYELKLDFINKEINPDIQTIFIPTSDVFSNISSSIIRELLKYKKYDIVKEYMNENAMWKYVKDNLEKEN